MMTPSLDRCPTCGRRITDYDPDGCETPSGQRYCLTHVLTEQEQLTARTLPGPWADLSAACRATAQQLSTLEVWADTARQHAEQRLGLPPGAPEALGDAGYNDVLDYLGRARHIAVLCKLLYEDFCRDASSS
jgi:hypothetical protein